MTDSKLTPRLSSALVWCLANRDDHKRVELGNGLVVRLYVDPGDARHVLLLRMGKTGPSAQEATTVLRHWPEPTPPGITWTAGTSGLWSWLAATWARPKQLSLADASAERPDDDTHHN